ncbi:MAG: hypothetical protein JXR76_10345 [Deltaproteobacteria bacterium]|nr:hypothetical protein [Deltaproteobacteria bacterium]
MNRCSVKQNVHPIPWWRHAVIYHIFVDRFSPGDGESWVGNPAEPVFCGGTLNGVTRRLDYLRKLGVNTLWLSPVQSTAAYHGYHVTDYTSVEPRFGGLQAFRTLLAAAKPEMRVILDWVPNHMHEKHPIFVEARDNPNSEYRDWFYFRSNGDYLKYLDIGELPKLNLDHPDACQYMINCCLYWLDAGVDGFRLDHVIGPSMKFWEVFRSAIKSRNPDAFIFGEATLFGIRRTNLPTLRLPGKTIFHRNMIHGKPVNDDVMLQYTGVFDGMLDFEFQHILTQHLMRPSKKNTSKHIELALRRHYARFPNDFALLSFLDNHDMNRFLFSVRNDKTLLKSAADIQFKQPHPPIIYYGTELGMTQQKPVWGIHGDLQARQCMPFESGDNALFRYYAQLIRQRKNVK